MAASAENAARADFSFSDEIVFFFKVPSPLLRKECADGPEDSKDDASTKKID